MEVITNDEGRAARPGLVNNSDDLSKDHPKNSTSSLVVCLSEHGTLVPSPRTPDDDRVHRDLDPDTLMMLHRQVADAMTVSAPQFGSPAWTRLADGDPAKVAATVQAAMAWWSGMALGCGVPADVIDREIAERVAAASKSIAQADPKLWRRVAADRICPRPQGRARSEYSAPEHEGPTR